MSYDQNEIYKAIIGRRSIRHFDSSRPVEREKIDMLLKAAMAAPSACNIQPWEFIVVDDAQLISGIKQSIPKYGDYNASTVIIACGDNEHIPWKDHGIIDCALALQNIMILAPSLELGSVYIGGFDRQAIKEMFHLPKDIEAIGIVYLGYPKEQKEPRTRYLEDAVHWNGFDGNRPRHPRPGNILVFGPESSV